MKRFERAVEAYRAFLHSEGRSARTIQNRVTDVVRLNRELDLLQPDMQRVLEAWRKDLQHRYEAERVSASKIQGDVAALRQFYSVCVHEHLYPTNPAAELRSQYEAPGLPRPMPVEDVQRLFEQVVPVMDGVVHVPVLRDRAMLELYLNGLRRIEVFRLTTDAVRYDVEEQTLAVRLIGKGEREGQIWLNANSASWLALYLLVQHAPDEYRDWIGELDQSVLLAVDRLLRRKLLDVSQPVFDLSTRQANAMFERYRDAAGLSKAYGPHSLRHTCATQLLENGVDIRVVQEILRHRSIKTTEIYTAVSKGLKGAAMQKLPTFAYAGAGV